MRRNSTRNSFFDMPSIVSKIFLCLFGLFCMGSQGVAASINDSGWILDASEDDHGFGGLIYPEGVLAGSADIMAARFIVFEDKVECQIKMREWDATSRIGIALLDAGAMQESDYDFSIGGTELMLPYWNGHGLHALVASPDSELYDYNAKVENPAGQPRPDNAVYIYHDPTLWLGENGNASNDPYDVFRLQVRQQQLENDGANWLISVTIEREILEQFLTFEGDEPVMYAALMSYFVTTSADTEFGALEVSAQLGGHDSWEDPDVYDIAFADNQADLLQPILGESGKKATSSLKGESQGFFKISLPWSTL